MRKLPKSTLLKYKTIAPFLIGVFALSPFSVLFGQEPSAVATRRAQLEQELAQLEQEINVQQKILQEKQRETVSLERDVAILNAEISSAALSIKARDLVIKRLAGEISGKESTIGSLNSKIQREKESLAQLLRKTYEIESFSLVEILLSNDDFSNFFQDIDSFDTIKSSLRESFTHIESVKEETQKQKEVLEDKRSEELELRQLQELQKRSIEKKRAERQQILKTTKGEEAIYQQVIKNKERSAATIRGELFQLRGTAAIPFEKALELANFSGSKTGVRPALILGIIAEESNLGENIGTGNWKVDMHPTRDQPIYRDITSRLGLNPDTMPVSKRAWYGWGGAMGPAQFIPSTWVLYEDRVARLTGKSPPNPWDAKDAFTASGLLLKDNGAGAGTYAAERLAALRYLAGWKNATKPAYAFYGDDVMALAAKYQKQIDILKASQ